MSSLNEFLEMGGYAFYVWSSVGLALAVLGWNVLAPVLTRRSLLNELRRKTEEDDMDDLQ
tara:strand:- start:394 stop:573 length:180 start_codon:yes stop_codon:yes gene_type:complete